MAKNVTNLNTELKNGGLSDSANTLYTNEEGALNIVVPGEENQPSTIILGGADKLFFSSADKTVVGSIEQTSFKEGMRTNQLIGYPSSFITPITPWISSSLPGPLAVISSPELLATIIALTIASTSSSKEDSYSFYKKTLPPKVIDNQELETQFFN